MFVLAADEFTEMIQNVARAGLLQGLGPNGDSNKVLCWQYADDTILFSETNQLTVLKLLLYKILLVSGHQINFAKSYAILLDEKDALQRQVANI